MDVVSYLKTELAALLDVVWCTDVRELEIQQGEVSVRLHRSEISESSPAVPHSEDSPALRSSLVHFVSAPLVGTFYRAGKPGMSPLVSEGSHVEQDTVVGIIEALQVLTDVSAGVVGTVTRVLETDGHPVEYGQSLFEVTVDG
jgi:acetyl-CoA carboxylase biotin carboxyl carrier protein